MSRRNLIVMLAIAIAALAIDQVSKILVIGALKHPGGSIRVIGDFLTFVLTYNPAGVFGLNIGRGLTYVVFPVLGILLVILFARSSQHLGFIVSYGLILGGAFGNLIDRIFRPRGVVDFISFQFFQLRLGQRQIGMDRWFTFNFADTCLVFGIILLMVFEVLSSRRVRDQAALPPTAPADVTAPAAEPGPEGSRDVS
jgi:signal peptidase II